MTLSESGRALSRRAVEEGSVLLKNDGVLPLKESAKIALVGPFADEHEIIGNWAGKGRIEESVTVKEGVESLLQKKRAV